MPVAALPKHIAEVRHGAGLDALPEVDAQPPRLPAPGGLVEGHPDAHLWGSGAAGTGSTKGFVPASSRQAVGAKGLCPGGESRQ